MAGEQRPTTAQQIGPGGPRFAVGAYIFGELKPADIALTADLGFPGIEPYRQLLLPYLARPHDLKALLDRHGVAMATCSNGGPGQSTDFISPAARRRTIDDHLAFARDFLTVFGCRHFKINLGARPPGGPSEANLAAIAATLNELGRRTAALGIRLAPHPHLWGPIERPHEVRRLLDLTDPAYVSLTLDTAHVALGGGDPLALLATAYDRVAAIHWKDTAPTYRGHSGPTPTREQHARENLYRDLGAGGVDLPAVWRLLRERGYQGWITLDLDPPRPEEGEGTVEEKLRRNRRYLTEELGVSHL
jgi:inosose dehydratase